MRAHGLGDQPQPSHQQDQHDQCIGKRLRPEVDMHVGDYSGQDKQRAGGREQPSDHAAPVVEQDGHAQQQRDERDAKAIGAPETPDEPTTVTWLEIRYPPTQVITKPRMNSPRPPGVPPTSLIERLFSMR